MSLSLYRKHNDENVQETNKKNLKRLFETSVLKAGRYFMWAIRYNPLTYSQ